MMGWKIPVVVPSAGRAGRVLPLAWVPDVVVVVPDHQAHDYRAAHPDARILSLPPESSRGIVAARQWIIDTFPDVYMMDDDVSGCVGRHKMKVERVSGEFLRDLIDVTSDMTRELGAYLFTFSSSPNATYYSPQSPFRLTGTATGHALGILRGHGLHFDPRSEYLEDVGFSLLNAHKHRLLFCDTRYAFLGQPMTPTPGGCSSTRSKDLVASASARLVELFGDVVKLDAWGVQKEVVIPF